MQKTYQDIKLLNKKKYSAVLMFPSEPEKRMARFREIVENAFEEIGVKSNDNWELIILDSSHRKTPDDTFEEIYNANLIIAECTDTRPNIFYMMGLAHGFGHPVCACYMTSDIDSKVPFNVSGRQRLNYSINTVEQQDILKKNIINWIKDYEKKQFSHK